MAEIFLKNNEIIGDFKKPYIIAEVNSSHNGNLEVAKKMIDVAKEAGCSCVKFQSWSKESLYSKTYYDKNPISKRIIDKFSLSDEKMAIIVNYCNEKKIGFSSTPYSNIEVDFLVEKCQVPYIKVASMDINNEPFLRYIALKGLPIILSTGMSDMNEIENAVKIIEDTGNTNLCLLHCISIYPPKISTVNLKNILGFRERFPQYPIGFSDHSLGVELAGAAVALGAAVIEKHLTLDASKMGMDNNMAIEPEKMKNLVSNCNNIYNALGQRKRIVLSEELEQRKKMRRSIIAKRNLKAGEILVEKDLDAKRPGDGIPPDKLYELVGKKLLHDIEEDTLISKEDLIFD